MKPFAFLITLLFFSNLWMKSAPRIWTDVQGRRVTGDFETIRGDIIVLRVGTQSYAFPISRLTAADQLFARSLAAKNPSEIRKMGSAALTCADGHLYFRYQNGMMKLVEASTRGYMEKGSFQIPNDRKNSWQHPVVAGGKLYLGAQNILYCYDIKNKG